MPPLTLREPSKPATSGADTIDRKRADESIAEVAIRIQSGMSGTRVIRLGDRVKLLLRSPKGSTETVVGSVVDREGDEFFTLRTRGGLKSFQRSSPMIAEIEIRRPTPSAKRNVRTRRSRALLGLRGNR